MKAVIKRFARIIAGDYAIYRIYQSPQIVPPEPTRDGGDRRIEKVDTTRLAEAASSLVREQVSYGGFGSDLYAFIENGKILGVCCYWQGERYRLRNFWPLREGEAKLVQIIVVPEARGKGVATRLIRQSYAEMRRNGIDRCYARIWHSNYPSIKAFQRAQWRFVATVIEFYIFNLGKRVRFVLRQRR